MDIKKEFSVQVLGVKADDFSVLKRSLFLSKSRSRSYVILDDTSTQKADIIIADIDYISAHPLADKTPSLVIVYGEDSTATVAENMPYIVSRPLLLPKVFSVFDLVTTEVLGFVPELTVGAVSETGSDMLRKASDKLQSYISSSVPQMDISVLVVDDSLIIREQMKMILETMGINVVTCDSGEQSVLMTQEQHYDIIFMDVIMPGIDGFAACKNIKHNSAVKEHIIMLTSENSSVSHIKGRLAGASGYLTKPVSIEALSEQLASFPG